MTNYFHRPDDTPKPQGPATATLRMLDRTTKHVENVSLSVDYITFIDRVFVRTYGNEFREVNTHKAVILNHGVPPGHT